MNTANSEIAISQHEELIQSTSSTPQYQYPDTSKEKFLIKLQTLLSSYLTNTEMMGIINCLEPAIYQGESVSKIIETLLACAITKVSAVKYISLLQIIPLIIELLQCEILGDCTQSGNIQSDLTLSE